MKNTLRRPFTIEKEDYERIKRLAEEQNRSSADLVRQAIKLLLEKYNV